MGTARVAMATRGVSRFKFTNPNTVAKMEGKMEGKVAGKIEGRVTRNQERFLDLNFVRRGRK